MNSVYVILILAAVILLAGTHTAKHIHLPSMLKPALAGGLGYLLLGVAGGPLVSDMISANALRELDPLINLAIGWVGLLLGLQLKVRDLRQINRRDLVGSLLHFFLVAAIALGGFFYFFSRIGIVNAFPTALSLSLLAGTSSPTFILLLEGKKAAVTETGRRMLLYANLSCIYAVLLHGLSSVIFFPQSDLGNWLQAPWRVLFSVGLAALLAFLFHFFMSQGAANRRLALLLIGMMVFCGGVAAVTQMPPLFLNMLVGAWLINQARHGNRLYHFLVVYERPLFLSLILVAGLIWQPLPMLWIGLLLFLGLRILGVGLGRLLEDHLWAADKKRHGGSRQVPFFVMLPQGGVALAIAISQWQLHPALADWIPAVVIPGVLLFSLLAGALTEGERKQLVVEPEPEA